MIGGKYRQKKQILYFLKKLLDIYFYIIYNLYIDNIAKRAAGIFRRLSFLFIFYFSFTSCNPSKSRKSSINCLRSKLCGINSLYFPLICILSGSGNV